MLGVGLAGCGPKKDGATATPTTSTPGGTTTPSVLGSPLADIPTYPSLRQVQKASQVMPQTAGYPGYTKAEVRMYETNDSPAKVADFYKAQMPAKGWGETQWLDTTQLNYGTYTKNNEADIAMIYVAAAGDGKTEVMVWRATK
jgi:hypothetical protein